VPALRDGRYCGYINVNLIANAQGLWPLEFTSRFGYPGFAICEALHEEPWEDIFAGMLARDKSRIATKPGFSAGVVLTVPPFPYAQGYEELSKGMPISFRPGFSDADRRALYLSEVAYAGGRLVTSGATGYIGVATGTGHSVREAADAALALAGKVVVPNLRYRRDIGERVASGGWRRLVAYGLVDGSSPSASREQACTG
jgi:phosphoribosylamine--glycine ligase